MGTETDTGKAFFVPSGEGGIVAFGVGSLCRLRSGGPTMTVVATHRGDGAGTFNAVEVRWFDPDGALRGDTFPLAAVEPGVRAAPLPREWWKFF